MISTIRAGLAAILFMGASIGAFAATPLELKSDVFVERQQVSKDGSSTVVLEKPNMVTPGDNLVFIVKHKNVGAVSADNFTVTNPLPAAVAFNGTSDGQEIVSIDSGQRWGKLATLRVAEPNGTTRPATLTDVTHIKWNLNQKLTAGAEGKLIFRGIVK